jgi:hypothetical protein
MRQRLETIAPGLLSWRGPGAERNNVREDTRGFDGPQERDLFTEPAAPSAPSPPPATVEAVGLGVHAPAAERGFVDFIREHGPSTVSEWRTACGIRGRQSLGLAIKRLEAAGLIEPLGFARVIHEAGRGRWSMRWALKTPKDGETPKSATLVPALAAAEGGQS